ncbi:MAG: hypothetical protein AAFX05_11260, partial [Planctomycetota bacterium]
MNTNDNETSCCGPDCCPDSKATTSPEQVRDNVRAGYAEIARSGQWSGVNANTANEAASCCGGASGGGG